MKRSSERLIDAFVLMMLLVFAFFLREEQPALAGVIVMASLKFWMDKNASEPHQSLEEKTAKAAADVLQVAKEQAQFTHNLEQKRMDKVNTPTPVEIIGQADPVEVKVIEEEQ